MPTTNQSQDIPYTAIEPLIDKYLIECAAVNSSNTYRTYSRLLRTFMDDMKEHKHINKQIIREWLMSLLDDYISPKTIKLYRIIINAFFNWCIENEYMEQNICPTLKLKDETKPRAYLTVEQVNTLLNASKPPDTITANPEAYIFNWLFLCLLVTTGLRIESACNIRLCDVDFDSGLILIRKAKGNKTYHVTAHDEVLASIKQHIVRNRPKGIPKDAPLFIRQIRSDFIDSGRYTDKYWTVNGKYYGRIDPTNFSARTCREYTDKICGNSVAAHSLRHSMANLFNENGEPAQVIQEQLGHSSISVTAKYLHGLSPNILKKRTQTVWGGMPISTMKK